MELLEEMWHWFLWIAIIGAAWLLLRAATRSEPVRYEATGRLFARHPLRLWQALAETLKGEFLILPDVSLNRMLKLAMEKKPKPLQDELGKLKADFVLLDPDQGHPRLAIKVLPAAAEDTAEDAAAKEAQQATQKEAQREADHLRELLQKANIPLWELEESTGYPKKMIKEELKKLLHE